MPAERFTRNWRGWIRSSEGYSVRLLGRTNLRYSDEYGDVHIHAETMSRPWSDIVVDLNSVLDRPERPRAEVVDRLRRAFAFVGWTLIEAGH